MKYAVRRTEKSERWSIWKRREICFLVIRESDDITSRRYGRSSYEAFCATRSYVGTFALHNLLAAFRSPCIRIRDGYDSPRHSFTCFWNRPLAISNRPFPPPPSLPAWIRGNSRRQQPPATTRFLRSLKIIISFFARVVSFSYLSPLPPMCSW